MSDKELQKVAYFKEQDLLDISDDETGFPDDGLLRIEKELADTKAMPPPTPLRPGTSNFLGRTPREQQKEFEEHTNKQRASTRKTGLELIRADTAPEANVPKSFTSGRAHSNSPTYSGKKSKRDISRNYLRSASSGEDDIPFYKRVGVIPRELKGGKAVKLAENIKLEPKRRQLLRGKLIYFYPNNDISMARRQRIHKVIQLGAAWINIWQDEVHYLMIDDPTITYTQVLKHLNRAGLPRKVILVKFDPYVPQCIQFNTLLEPSAARFLVKGAPAPTIVAESQESPFSSPSSHASLQVKLSKRQQTALGSEKTDSISSISAKDSFSTILSPGFSSTNEDRVEDSFVVPSSDPLELSTRGPDSYNDALSEIIREAKATSHLPLDEEESDYSSSSRPTTASGNDSGTDQEQPALKQQPSQRQLKNAAVMASMRSAVSGSRGINQLAFQCMDPRASNASTAGNPNARTIQILEDMCKYYDQMQDTWRTLAYRRGVGTLRKQTTKISTKEQAEALPFIGSRLAEKIEEIVLTDRLRKLENTKDDPTDRYLQLFLGVYGAGLTQANKWIQSGYRTLDDLLEKAKLTESQKVGVQHYEDFATRIPRAEVEQHGEYVRNTLHKLDPNFEIYIMGSYRRGAKDSGDIDLIITKKNASLSTMRAIVFGSLVPELFNAGFLKVSLATSHRIAEGTKWHGASCLPSSTIWRRLDLLLVPEDEMGAALIYFTGNDIFNRSMRLLASKKGMRLNQRGLYKDVTRGKNRERLNDGTLVEGKDEKRIFEILGVPWRPPTERIC
jgi:DNA polymerase IV